MDISSYEKKIQHAINLMYEEYSDDYSDDTYSMLLDEVLEMGMELFGESWFDQILRDRVEIVKKIRIKKGKQKKVSETQTKAD